MSRMLHILDSSYQEIKSSGLVQSPSCTVYPSLSSISHSSKTGIALTSDSLFGSLDDSTFASEHSVTIFVTGAHAVAIFGPVEQCGLCRLICFISTLVRDVMEATFWVSFFTRKTFFVLEVSFFLFTRCSFCDSVQVGKNAHSILDVTSFFFPCGDSNPGRSGESRVS